MPESFCFGIKSIDSASILRRRLSPHGRRRELHARGARGHRRRLRPHHRGIGRGIEGAAGHREPYGHVPDGQGPYRRGAARLRRPAAPPRPGALLHAQEHLHIPFAGRPEAGHGRCTLIVRNRRTALLVVWYACFPLRRICTRFSGYSTTI